MDDKLSIELRQQALEVAANEPELATLLHRTVLAQAHASFEDAVSSAMPVFL